VKTLYQLDQKVFGSIPVVLAMGFFDGVHKGHQAILNETIQSARRQQAEAWVLTFDPHPLNLIRPEAAPNLLTSAEHKCLLFEQNGMDGCVVMNFDQTLRAFTPQQFMDLLTENIRGLRQLTVGESWMFGGEKQGNTDILKKLAEHAGVATAFVESICWEGHPVSSTRIRKAVLDGDLEEASNMLGRPFSVYGHVVHGREIGRTHGYPTANIEPHHEIHLPDGIYAAYALVDGQQHQAAAYIGKRPTFGDGEWIVEAFLLDANLDLYDKEIEVSFLKKIRDDRAFENTDDLVQQITQDVKAIRNVLSRKIQK